ncbi:MAG: winged helix-turn-helix domain-containing protein [Actinobacteria bacterium]|nr:winged helix-turn-helix domain-containing protein [Actinomycetota bacterium]MBV9253372.1 winged helix-turn-helix domain-containing protein [Actinomycetota bacterium]
MEESAVVMLRWPEEEARRAALSERGEARLLLVDQGATAPEVVDALEDWIRVPADEADVRARADTLERRRNSRQYPHPTVDDNGLLRFGTSWVALAPVESRLVAVLVQRYGTVVGRQVLTRAGWQGVVPSRNALDVKILRLRRRLTPLGLSIRTVRARGYLLEATGASDP